MIPPQERCVRQIRRQEGQGCSGGEGGADRGGQTESQTSSQQGCTTPNILKTPETDTLILM